MNILGVSGLYHDSAACLVQDGRITAAAQEERFTRKKHDERFPINAIEYCLGEGSVEPGSLDMVVFYEKPLTKFFRIMRTHLERAPATLPSFLRAVPSWFQQKLWLTYTIEKSLRSIGHPRPPKVFYTEHHQSHAASAFFPSPFEEAAILTMDGVGEWATTTIGKGEGNRIELLKEIRFPHSIGMLYSAFTYFTGFRVNSGEYKLMGLAPYGRPVYADLIKEHLIHIEDDGSFWLDQRYFDYVGGLRMTNDRFSALLGGPPRLPESPITQREMDLARSIQAVTEEVVLKLAATAVRITGHRNLCLAGGVALNCVANGEVLRAGIVDDLWIQPAAGDAGGALGAALFAWYQHLDRPRCPESPDAMQGTYLGPGFEDDEIGAFLDEQGYPYERLAADRWPGVVAKLLAEENVIGLCQGRMEFGPRALGHRSIIGDPRSAKMQSTMNLKIKYRESFRPFAPSVLRERVQDYFEMSSDSPYMLLVAPVRPEIRTESNGGSELSIEQKINQSRSTLPAITHVDYSARVQTVHEDRSPEYYALIKAFEELTGTGVIINTSFNVRGEPLVCTPEDAYRCFMRTEMDYLVLGTCLLDKRAQPATERDEAWKQEFALD
ncbi:MAG: carbamoyltransferase [Deltaproteobacteria bacterium]|jgi:carbamoyltransferase|nr:carbamoyltransferase [Deltaproteobacteria bacterium]